MLKNRASDKLPYLSLIKNKIKNKNRRRAHKHWGNKKKACFFRKSKGRSIITVKGNLLNTQFNLLIFKNPMFIF